MALRKAVRGILDCAAQLSTQWLLVSTAVPVRPRVMYQRGAELWRFERTLHNRRCCQKRPSNRDMFCRDPMRPSAELRLISKVAQVQVRGKEALLHNLHSLCIRARHPQCETVEIVPISLNELLKGEQGVFHFQLVRRSRACRMDTARRFFLQRVG